jgi:transcriptional regulator with XRE-family HTH domain
MMTGAQIRAARGFLDWTVRDLGKKSKVHFNTIHAIERGKSTAKPETLVAIRKTIEKAGIQFTSGPGVRLKLNKARAGRRIDRKKPRRGHLPRLRPESQSA